MTQTQMPTTLALMGCGRHRLRAEPGTVGPVYRCTNGGCTFAAHPGQLYYAATAKWYDGSPEARA